MRIWVTLPYGGTKEQLDIISSIRIESLRRRIGQLPAVMEESGAWTINGWQSPKIMHGGRLLVDGKSVAECGIQEDGVIDPLYDSQAYGLTVLDPDFYSEMVPQDVSLPPCPPCCENAKEKVSDGLSGIWNWTQATASNIASGVAPKQWACVAGVGLAVSQDQQLLFVVEAIAPGGGAEEEGTIQVGDVIKRVDGISCVNTEGLSAAQIQNFRLIPEQLDENTASGDCRRSISTLKSLETRLKGFPMSHVFITVARQGGWREYEVEVQRRVLPRLSATYM